MRPTRTTSAASSTRVSDSAPSKTVSTNFQGEKEEFTTSADKLTIALYDFDFTLFYKDTYDKIRNIGTATSTKQKPGTRPTSASSSHPPPSSSSKPQTPSISPPGQQTPPVTVGSPSVPHIDRSASSQSLAADNAKIQSLENENNLLKKNVEEKDQSLKQLSDQFQQLQVQQQKLVAASSTSDQQQLIDGLNSIVQEKERENDILQQSISKFEDLIVDKDDIIEELNLKIETIQNQKDSESSLGMMGDNSSSADIFEVMRIKQDNQDYLTKLESMEQSMKELQQAMQTLRQENQMLQHQRDEAIKKMTSSPPQPPKQEPTTSPPHNLTIAKLEGELTELKTKYSSLLKDQEEVVVWATSLETENSTLKAQLGK
ncbi:hypothetical protein DFA_01742 [Cavenderia fasciculata]|uniref:Uncharacterized protein n=1 Tax=Cavenderia fasciculata TaxID=261658 RepID=F4PUJ2_CACFS|nr:uncharacterized protein DFA_01742 [Cavenderia fasciculata]EGG21856.1 hypothetical protein DFA_01742 [Cavenderia fasciculata]|eukprot:XP_004359707.1 hypothetical protein DFA_01742 [Cavenderia fasciculata]